jgi:hypothetical protein
MSLQRTELQLLDEKLYMHRRNLTYRLDRKIAGGVGTSNRMLRARRRRRERDLEHRRVVAPDAFGKKKKLPRPRSYLGTRLRAR